MPNNKSSKKDLESYKKLLVDIKEKMINQIKQMSADATDSHEGNAGDISGHAMHMADVATDMYDREFSLGLASNERELLVQVDEALRRIDEGNYGACDECKGSIPVARLKALPYAKNCTKCQEKLDTK